MGGGGGAGGDGTHVELRPPPGSRHANRSLKQFLLVEYFFTIDADSFDQAKTTPDRNLVICQLLGTDEMGVSKTIRRKFCEKLIALVIIPFRMQRHQTSEKESSVRQASKAQETPMPESNHGKFQHILSANQSSRVAVHCTKTGALTNEDNFQTIRNAFHESHQRSTVGSFQ